MSKTWSSLLLGFDSLKSLFLLIVICIKIRVHYDVVGILVTSESSWSIKGYKFIVVILRLLSLMTNIYMFFSEYFVKKISNFNFKLPKKEKWKMTHNAH